MALALSESYKPGTSRDLRIKGLRLIGLTMRTDVSGNAVSKSKRVPESRVTKKSVKLSTYLVFTVTEFVGLLKIMKVFVKLN